MKTLPHMKASPLILISTATLAALYFSSYVALLGAVMYVSRDCYALIKRRRKPNPTTNM
jgi:hypothetical protein